MNKQRRSFLEHSKSLLLVAALFHFVPCTEQGVFGSRSSGPLYGPDDQVFVLSNATIKEHIYGSSRGWVVEFFSSWCGHCQQFAPKWKQFAVDLAQWQNVLVIAGIDCADEINVEACRQYDIMGYPSIRFFPPHLPMNKKIIKDGKEVDDLIRGEPIDRPENLSAMKRDIINKLVPHLPNFYDQTPPKTPIENSDKLWEFIQENTKPPSELPSFALVVFEAENSHVVKEVALSLSRFPSASVLRFTKKNGLYDELNLEGWPAAGYIKRNHTSGKIPFGKNQNIPEYLVKMAAKFAHLSLDDLSSTSNIRENVKSEVKVVNEDLLNNIEEPKTDTGVVSIEDLIHAVRNSLRNEVGLFKEISGNKLQVLKSYVHTIAEFFPADRREMVLFLMKLSSWLGPLDRIDDTIYMDKLTELEISYHPWDIDVNTWGNCKGSVPGRRGYTCSLWSLFHTLTVIAHEKNQNFPVLDAIHGYVKEFFGCKDCAMHFTKMVADDGALMINPIKDQLLWLWKAHNKVNLRLKGGITEDNAYPKIQYPSETQCPDCYNDSDDTFDEEVVLKYLLKIYSKPERTLQPVKYSAERVYAHENRHRMSGYFNGTDYWLFCLVYLSVAILLVFAYIHFRVGKRFDISYLFCGRSSHHRPLGKSNV